MIGDSYGNMMLVAKKRWFLERARQILAIESEMTLEERQDPCNKYWIEFNGQKYTQVEEINPLYFKPNTNTIGPEDITVEENIGTRRKSEESEATLIKPKPMNASKDISHMTLSRLESMISY